MSPNLGSLFKTTYLSAWAAITKYQTYVSYSSLARKSKIKMLADPVSDEGSLLGLTPHMADRDCKITLQIDCKSLHCR